MFVHLWLYVGLHGLERVSSLPGSSSSFMCVIVSWTQFTASCPPAIARLIAQSRSNCADRPACIHRELQMVKPKERNQRFVDAVMTIPKGTLYPMCGMNLAFDRYEAT
jgi:hypothetical protein